MKQKQKKNNTTELKNLNRMIRWWWLHLFFHGLTAKLWKSFFSCCLTINTVTGTHILKKSFFHSFILQCKIVQCVTCWMTHCHFVRYSLIVSNNVIVIVQTNFINNQIIKFFLTVANQYYFVSDTILRFFSIANQSLFIHIHTHYLSFGNRVKRNCFFFHAMMISSHLLSPTIWLILFLCYSSRWFKFDWHLNVYWNGIFFSHSFLFFSKF